MGQTNWYSRRPGVWGGPVLGLIAALAFGIGFQAQPARAQETPPAREFPQAQSYRVFISMAAKTAAGIVPVQAQSELDQVLALTNAERAKVGCGALSINNTLAVVAQAHAVDMAENDFFDHDSLNGASPFDRMRAAGYSFSSAAENIAAGYSTPASVMNGWMNSSGHRANILNCSYTEIGIGFYKLASDTGDINYVWYWVQDFGRP